MKNSQTQRNTRALKAEANATEKQRKNRAARKAMGIALIERPLRFIKPRSPVAYATAQAFAKHGNGYGVKAVAYTVLRTA